MEVGLKWHIYKPGKVKDTGSHQKLGERHGTDFASEPLEGLSSADILILDFGPPELWENKLLLF